MEDRCVCCGEIIPEGRMVCPACSYSFRRKAKRLIDANALQLEPDPWGGMNGVLIYGRSGGKTMGLVQAALKNMIENAPTVDAVEVVRCKDCKWAINPYPLVADFQKLACSKGINWRSVEPTHFCSYGERRTDV